MSNQSNNENGNGPNRPFVEDILYTDKTLAKLLGYSESTIRRYRRMKMISYIQPGGKVFYTKEIIEEFLNRWRRFLSIAAMMQFVVADGWYGMMEML